MRLKKLIYRFEFTEDQRNEITLHDDVRLNPTIHCVTLKEDDDGLYSTSANLYVKTRIFNPGNVRQWLGFEANITNIKIDGQVVTSFGYRLGNGTDEYYWDGGGWSVVGANDWSTEEEIATNISSFPITEKKLQVIVNLTTTDASVTPELIRIKILYASDIEFQEDLIYRTLIRQLREGVRLIADTIVKMEATGTTVVLNPEAPYNVIDIDAVFNHDDDPNHETDIFSSYDSGTKTITLTGPVDIDKTLYVQLYCEPEIALSTSREYQEIGRLPALILDEISLVEASNIGQQDSVIDKAAGTGVKIHPPLQGDLEIQLLCMAAKGIDLVKIVDEVKRFCENHPTIRSYGLDIEYRLWLIEEFNLGTASGLGDIHSARMRLRLVNILFALRDAENVYAVKRLILGGDMNAVIEN